ncbi:ankyrin-1 [Verticillium dahliae VdLs.17]|uniref:Ankyrin-1 n=1 Tax=Verticillium dahliae (strain VdLs.17 / ATCC MYA-4575 / FGSC 10137) TaxID=498257 RepID=G2WW09_VERDV|nr:ankyrin-1 [Verticillium dahliae VdLs.17]EGY19779.1 ankyrin-1 [Verticillium dahliae VdLs.17]
MRDEAPLHHPALDDERIQRAAVEIFGLVEQICEEATSAGRLRLDTAADSSASRDPCLKPSGGGARRKLSWAMGGRWRRTEKLELFKELVQTLYNLVPPDDYDAGRPVASAWSTEFGRIMSRLEAWARQDVHAWLRHIPGERYHDSLQRRLDGTCAPASLWLHGPAGFGKTIMCANMIQHLTATLATPTAHFFFSSDASSSRDDPFLAMRSWVSQVISTHDGAFQLALCLLKNGRNDSPQLSIKQQNIEAVKILLQKQRQCPDGEQSRRVYALPSVKLLLDNHAVATINDATTEEVTPLHVACMNGHADIVRLLLRHGADSSRRCSTHLTAFGLAVYNGSAEIVRMFLEFGASAEGSDDDDFFPVHLAAQAGHLDLLHLLISHGADVSARSKTGRTTLYLAAAGGEMAVVKTLIEMGVDVNARDQFGHTALVASADIGHLETVTYLLAHGACCHAVSKRGGTALSAAVRSNNASVVRAILQHGSPSSSSERHGCRHGEKSASDQDVDGLHGTSDMLVLEPAQMINTMNTHHGRGNAPVHLAAHHNSLELFELLLDHGADRMQADGITALHTIVQLNYLDLAKSLLRRGVHVDGGRVHKAIHYAVMEGRTEMVKLLLDSGVSIESTDALGNTALSWAAKNGNLDLIRLLLDHGVDHAAANVNGTTALHTVSQNGHTNCIGLLLDHGANPTAADSIGVTPLHYASRHGHPDAVRLLLDAGAAVDATGTDECPQTPLHTAVIAGRVDIVKLLLDRGADVTRRHAEGPLPLYSAASHGHLEVARALLDAGAHVGAAGGHSAAGWPALLAAVHFDHEAVARLLLERGLAYCDSCLRDVPDGSGEECARCGHVLFYLCAECFGRGCGCRPEARVLASDSAKNRGLTEAIAGKGGIRTSQALGEETLPEG